METSKQTTTDETVTASGDIPRMHRDHRSGHHHSHRRRHHRSHSSRQSVLRALAGQAKLVGIELLIGAVAVFLIVLYINSANGPGLDIPRGGAATAGRPQPMAASPVVDRRAVYRELTGAEDRALRQARSRYPELRPTAAGYSARRAQEQAHKQIDEESRVDASLKAAIAARHGLSAQQLDEILNEGRKAGWPVR